MSLEIKYSSYRVGNWGIWALIMLGLSVWFTYDGYFSEKFIADHTVDGVADDTLKMNQRFWYVGVPLGLVSGVMYFICNKKRITADDEKITLNTGKTIKFDSIEAVDHTEFKSKGRFVVEYEDGGKQKYIFSNKAWDGLEPLLENIISKIS